ncbi:MAG: fibronectin type III domain-containing protein [Leptospiraceae bacterium]|nr:fibronectin type III domain-containing protein [Leptospiraceae bacterium]
MNQTIKIIMATVVINLIACSAKANYNNPTDNVALLLMQLISPLVGNSITINGDTADTTPPVFAGLTSATAASSTSITLNWAAGTDNITPQETLVYDIYAATISGGENFSLVSFSSTAGAVTYTVTGLTANTAYYFIVRARDSAGNRDSNIVQKTALTAPLPTVTSISPTTGTMGTPITISGTNFDTTLANNIVTLPNCTLQVVSATKTQIVAIPPITGECNSGGITVQTTSSNIPSSSYGNFSYYNKILFVANTNNTVTSYLLTTGGQILFQSKKTSGVLTATLSAIMVDPTQKYLYYVGTSTGVVQIDGLGNLNSFIGMGSTNTVTLGGSSLDLSNSRIYIGGSVTYNNLNVDGTFGSTGVNPINGTEIKVSSFGSYIYGINFGSGTFSEYALSGQGLISSLVYSFAVVPGFSQLIKDDSEKYIYVRNGNQILSLVIWPGGGGNPPGTIYNSGYSVSQGSNILHGVSDSLGFIYTVNTTFTLTSYTTFPGNGNIAQISSIGAPATPVAIKSLCIDNTDRYLFFATTTGGTNFYSIPLSGGTFLSGGTLQATSTTETASSMIIVKKYK